MNKRFSLVLLVLFAVFVLASCQDNGNDSSTTTNPTTEQASTTEELTSTEPTSTTEEVTTTEETPTDVAYTGNTEYSLIVEGFEWGASVTKMVVSVDDAISASALDINKFVVNAETTPRTITNVYLSDDSGNEVTSATSNYFTIEMEIGFAEGEYGGSAIDNSSAFGFDFVTFLNSWRDLSIYSLELAENKTLDIDGTTYTSFTVNSEDYVDRIVPQTAGLVKGTNTYDDITLRYAAYEDESLKNDSGQNPLIIWLHGAGEGGTDVDIALLGNEVTNLYDDEIQNYFRTDELAGAYVYVVQTPTMWMDGGDGVYQSGDGSIYTDTLWDAITNYVAGNSDIDTSRIYLGGCSNGGYMTLNMLFHHPDYFAAAYPIAEAYSDEEITDEMIQSIKDVPIWFTQAADDTTVDPTTSTIPTYVRLVQAGADAHFSYFEHVNGLEADVQYFGHWSWVYTLQDRAVYDQDQAAVIANGASAVNAPSSTSVTIDGEEVTLWGWIAEQINE